MISLRRWLAGVFCILFVTPTMAETSRDVFFRGVTGRSSAQGETSTDTVGGTSNRSSPSGQRSVANVRQTSGTNSSRATGNTIERPRDKSSDRKTSSVSAAGATARTSVRDSISRSVDTNDVRTTISRTPVLATSGRTATTRSASPVLADIVTRTATTPKTVNASSTRKSSVTTRPTNSIKSRATTDLTSGGLATLMETCKTQYTQCMDNYCNGLDDALGRCSCSKNIKNYSKTSSAQKQANEALQDVAQQIQYIGLSREEIETLFSQTEAELTMQKENDKSQIKSSLDKIRDMIIDVPSSSSVSATNTGLSFNLDGLVNFDLGATGIDLSSLFSTSQTGASISNQRGEQLYKTAAARCKKAVLDTCSTQGVSIALIVNSYDMEIDRDCILYERSLTDGNDAIAQTVRNAQSMLQRARLMVKQQKNAYDLQGCIGALDACMQEDIVCGSDYTGCLDPTGKYIVDGEIVVGSTPGYVVTGSVPAPSAQYSQSTLMGTWYYDSKFAWGATTSDGSVQEYISKYTGASPVKKTSSKMAEYLQYKIGYNEKDKNYGLCMSVLNKCQNLTYSKDGTYIPNNQVVTEYLNRALVQIKRTQDAVLTDYAENCVSDVSSCLTANDFDTSKPNIAINACRSMIVTCMSVNGDLTATPTPSAMHDWVVAIMGTVDSDNGSGGGNSGGNTGDDNGGGNTGDGGDDNNGDTDDTAAILCSESGGSWSNNTCVCSATGTKQNSDKTQCVCDTAKNFAGTPTVMGCSCATKYTYQAGVCKPTAEINCTGSGGTWSNNTCTCKTNYELNKDGFCISTVSPQTLCEESGGKYVSNRCDCSQVDMNGDGVYDVVYYDSSQGTCEQYSFKEWCTDKSDSVYNTDDDMCAYNASALYQGSWQISESEYNQCTTSYGTAAQQPYKTVPGVTAYNLYNLHTCSCSGSNSKYTLASRDAAGNCACLNKTFMRNPANVDECVCSAGTTFRDEVVPEAVGRYISKHGYNRDTLLANEGTKKLPLYLYADGQQVLDSNNQPIDIECVIKRWPTNPNSSWYCEPSCVPTSKFESACAAFGDGVWDASAQKCTCNKRHYTSDSVIFSGLSYCRCDTSKGFVLGADGECNCADGLEYNADVQACVPPGSTCSAELTAGLKKDYVACKCDSGRGFSNGWASADTLENGYLAYGTAPSSSSKFSCACLYDKLVYDEATELYQCVARTFDDAIRVSCALSGGSYNDMYGSWVCTCDDLSGLESTDDETGCKCKDAFAENPDWRPADYQTRLDDGANNLGYSYYKNKCNSCANSNMTFWDGKFNTSEGVASIAGYHCVEDVVQEKCTRGGCTYNETAQNCPPCVK